MDKANIKRTEERDYYRIDDVVEFSFYPLPNHVDSRSISPEILDRELFSGNGAEQFRLRQALHHLSDEAQPLLTQIQSNHPQTAEYIGIFNRKFDLLINYSLGLNQQDLQEVNLSLGGLSFASDQELEPSTRLIVKLVMPSSHYGFICSAVVVSQRYLPGVNSSKPHRISLKFVDIAENDEQALSKHILQKQADILKSAQS